jgi:V/A-type H+/Na+-transporting ATPase subunit E
MSEELQGLLEKIHDEGIKKADVEKDKIIADAQEQAKKIIADAETKAANLTKGAEKNAAASEKRAAATIKQAARDIVLALNVELLERLNAVVKSSIGEAMTPEFMEKIIIEMVGKFQPETAEAGIDIMLASAELKKLEKLLSVSLTENLKQEPEMFSGHDFSSGLKLGFKGSDIFFDVSDEVLAEMICSYVGPRLGAVLKDEQA